MPTKPEGSAKKKKKKRAAPRTTARKSARARGPTGVQLGEDTARSMILQGAARVFAAKGARLSSVEDMLEASGVSRRTFYRFFDGKDAVLAALYHLGTDGLLAACRIAVECTQDPLERFERCIDAHLNNARVLSRLMFVLGGEAQDHESPLHARRREVHSELVSMLTDGLAISAADALAVRAAILALEGLVRLALEEGDEGRAVSSTRLAQVKEAMMRLCADALTDR